MGRTVKDILGALVHIQTHLEEALPLERLAALAGLSPFHFQRTFKQVVGESPKAYVQRLRLERGAFYLKINQARILDIALMCGFRSHEIFSRAFKRRFGVSPRTYRQTQAISWDHLATPTPERLNPQLRDYELSPTRIVDLKSIDVAFVRNVGPYETVDTSLFDRLVDWSRKRGIYRDHSLLLGIGHDAPGITPPEKLRFDCCVQVFGRVEPEGDIGFQQTPATRVALTTYLGGWDMAPGYVDIMRQIARMRDLKVVGLPAIEIYHATRVAPKYDLAHADVCIPVVPNK